MTAADAALMAASRHVPDAEAVTLGALLRRRPAHADRAQVFVARVEPGAPTDVAALRALVPGGVPPLVVAVPDFERCMDLAARAALHARQSRGVAVVLLEHETAELEGMPVEPDLVKPGPLPPDPPLDPLLPALERALRLAAHRAAGAPRLAAHEPDPTPGARAEWLVVSYGSSVAPAAQAVALARDRGVRVGHLQLHTLWPVPEEAIARAGAAARHVVIPERNLGQYADELRRLLPGLMIIPAGTVPGPVSAGLILERLLHTPRCC
ncbi:MAG: hypothetical protein HS108_08275 [Planctomycetes bacterium]|nr:hypothetical protein [Planctomycetota bacterium]MCL4730142.1 hypothetical protein [Planctomycetota bacterium]